MPFLKLTPKVSPASVNTPKPPRAVNPPKKAKSVRTLAGLSQAEIEEAIEKAYIDRGALLLRFDPTSIPGFIISIDGRFGIRLNQKLNFFQLFIFKEKQDVSSFREKTYNDLKFMQSTQLYYFYNAKMPTADMQMRKLEARIVQVLGAELEKIIEEKKKNWYKLEDEAKAVELAAERVEEDIQEVVTPVINQTLPLFAQTPKVENPASPRPVAPQKPSVSDEFLFHIDI